MMLAELQQAFWSIATRETGFERHDPAAAFAGGDAFDASSRMEIYANMFEWRQIDALREDYPKLAGLMGAEAFYALGEEYVRAHPSVHHSLSKFGRHLARFLKGHPGSRPDLADMAVLEWARAEVFEEAADSTLSLDALREMAGGELARQSFTLVHAFRALRLDHDVLDLWQQLEDDLTPAGPQRASTFVAVWRREFEVFHSRLEGDEARALERAISGQPVSLICEAFEDRPDAVPAAFRAITRWFSEGWVASPRERRES